MSYSGTTIWRVLIPVTTVAHVPDLTASTAWWHGPAGHVYFSQVDDPEELGEEERMFEIAARNVVDPEAAVGKRFSWGIPATNKRVQSHFKVGFCFRTERFLWDLQIHAETRNTTPESETRWHKSQKDYGGNSLRSQVQDWRSSRLGIRLY